MQFAVYHDPPPDDLEHCTSAALMHAIQNDPARPKLSRATTGIVMELSKHKGFAVLPTSEGVWHKDCHY